MSLSAQHYIVRPGNKAVPLIAVDELPHYIRIENVPRTITSFKDLAEMTYVGEVADRHELYKVVDLNKDIGQSLAFARTKLPPSAVSEPNIQATGEDRNIAQDSTSGSVSSTKPDDPEQTPSPVQKGLAASTFKVDASDKPSPALVPASTPPLPKKYYGINEYQPEPAKPGPGPPYGQHQALPLWKDMTQLPLKPVHGKKIYCSYWMSKGECNFAQQGCQFKHIMPDNLVDLNTLGYQDIPKWYRDKFGVGSLTAVPGSGAHMRGKMSSASGTHAAPVQRKLAAVVAKPRRKSVRSVKMQSLLDLEDDSKKTGLMSSRYAVLTPLGESSRAGTEHEESEGDGLPGRRRVKKVGNVGRRGSVMSDYECELARALEERDRREAAEYAVVVAEYAKKRKAKV